MPTLIDAFSRHESQRKAGIISNAVETSPMMGMFQTGFAPGFTVTKFRRAKLPNPGYRKFRENFTPAQIGAEEPIKTSLAIFGDEIIIDPQEKEIATREGRNYESELITEVSEAIGLNWKKHVIGKDRTGIEPMGIYEWVDYWNPKLPTDRKVIVPFSGANGDTIAGAGSANLIRRMRRLINAVRPTFLIANETIMEEIEALTQSADSAALAKYFSWKYVKVGEFEREVAFWGAIPIFDAGYDSQKDTIMQFDETEGINSDASSIVAVRSRGTKSCKLLMKNKNTPDVSKYMQDGMHRIKIELPNAIDTDADDSVGRLTGIRTP